VLKAGFDRVTGFWRNEDPVTVAERISAEKGWMGRVALLTIRDPKQYRMTQHELRALPTNPMEGVVLHFLRGDVNDATQLKLLLERVRLPEGVIAIGGYAAKFAALDRSGWQLPLVIELDEELMLNDDAESAAGDPTQ
jgi:hypothetical protein